MDRIIYTGVLPDSFSEIPVNIYKNSGLKFNEKQQTLQYLINEFKENAELLIYTDHLNFRMIGMFSEDSNIAYFGFWESIDNIDINIKAFDLFKEDAKSRNIQQIIGPINFNTYLPYRIRIGEFPAWSQFDKEPVNPTYYSTILSQLGFDIELEYESRMIRKENIKDVYFSKESILSDLKNIPFDFISITPEFWSDNKFEIYQLIHETFGDNPFYKKISFDQFNLLFTDNFVKRLCPHSSVTFRDQKTGRLSAISLCHPNYMEIQDQSEEITFQTHYQLLKKKTLLAKSVGVHPDFRKNGLMNFLGAYGMISFQEYYEEVLFCLMREGNLSLRFSDFFPHDKAKYALYSYRF